MKKGYLVLQDGQVFEGFRFGGPADAVGELVFTTGMCGYLETLTDPSYAGQIVMQTYPLIGNYGIIPEDFEGACCVRGYVVREWCEERRVLRPGLRGAGVVRGAVQFPLPGRPGRFFAGPGRAGALGCGHPGADPDHPGARRHERRDL